jgi:hypothetical protein
MTVNCLEFRRALGADPNHANAESLTHRAACPACEKYAQEILRLNGLIKRALEVPVPEAQPLPIPVRTQPRWYALAASILLALSATIGALWLAGYPRESLAMDVVKHMAHEPQAMTPTQARVSAELLAGALKAKGLQLSQPMDDVSYLESCLIHGHFVPHLVVQTARGPVTVLLLTEEKIQSTERFDEQQYHGVLVPMPRGAMAVIATDASVVDLVAEKISGAVGFP